MPYMGFPVQDFIQSSDKSAGWSYNELPGDQEVAETDLVSFYGKIGSSPVVERGRVLWLDMRVCSLVESRASMGGTSYEVLVWESRHPDRDESIDDESRYLVLMRFKHETHFVWGFRKEKLLPGDVT